MEGGQAPFCVAIESCGRVWQKEEWGKIKCIYPLTHVLYTVGKKGLLRCNMAR